MIATMEQHKMWTDSIVSVAPKETSHIMTNNLSVSFLAFAGGITFGVCHVRSSVQQRHDAGRDCSGVPPVQHVAHVVELYCAARVTGIAGHHHRGRRWLSHRPRAMLFPGGYRWKESVAKGGIEATQLVAGVIPMLVVAGCLEGFFSPSHAPVWLKFTVGGLLFTLLLTWLFRPVKVSAVAQIQ